MNNDLKRLEEDEKAGSEIARFIQKSCVDAEPDLDPAEVLGLLEPHHQRMIIEEKNLSVKVIALAKFVHENPAFKQMGVLDQNLMRDQLRHMRAYRSTLIQRIMRINTWGKAVDSNQAG